MRVTMHASRWRMRVTMLERCKHGLVTTRRAAMAKC
jgi:hypothetical protein